MNESDDDVHLRPYMVNFPHDEFYENQLDAMDRIYDTLRRGDVVLFEGACGTGKTLSSLAPALAVGREASKKVVIATNVHQQMVQFQQEASLIKKKRDVRVVVLKGKELLCPLGCGHGECDLRRQGTQNLLRVRKRLNVKRIALESIESSMQGGSGDEGEDAAVAALKMHDEIEREEDLQGGLEATCCDFLLENLKTGGGEEFRKWLHDDVRSPEEVSGWARERGMCGYELLKGELSEADLVICNYQHLLNPFIMKIFLGWLGCGLSDVIAIFDEAHNLESSAREHAGATLARTTLRRAMDEAADAPDIPAQVVGLLDATDTAMEGCLKEVIRFGQREALTETWDDLAICELDGSRDIFFERVEMARIKAGWDIGAVTDELVDAGLKRQELYDRLFHEGKEPHRRTSAMLTAGEFLNTYVRTRDDPRYYPLMGVRRDADGDMNSRLEVFACMPTEITSPLLSGLYSAVLMSATLQPFEALRRALGIERRSEELSYGLTFPAQRRTTLAVDTPPLFSNRRAEPSVTDSVCMAITKAVENTPGATVVFFPSYQELNRYRGLLQLDAELFVDRLGVPADDAKKRFFECAERGEHAVLFSYLWGTLAEGVDYCDSRARTVVIVGVGYPYLGYRNRAVQRAYDSVLGDGSGWEYAVSAPTIRRIRQAMGRNVRSPDDFGARVLLDRRYVSSASAEMGRYSVNGLFPMAEKNELSDCDVTSLGARLKVFFQSVKPVDADSNRPA